jgi:hypothetical protein
LLLSFLYLWANISPSCFSFFSSVSLALAGLTCYFFKVLSILPFQSLVSCGGGRRPADGLCKQHVRTIQLP